MLRDLPERLGLRGVLEALRREEEPQAAEESPEHRRISIIAGNWKMHTTLSEALMLARAIRGQVEGVRGVEVVLCPPFVSLAAVAEDLLGSTLRVGAQDMHPEPQGAFTGEVAPTMLAGLCDDVILGHSERRAYFRESDHFVNAKVRAALAHGLRPILCVGETLAQREAGRTAAVLRRQTRRGLAGVEDVTRVVIAYEPVWAIGTGRAATPEDAAEGSATIRQVVARIAGAETAEAVRVLYGGSVSAANAAELLAQPGIDGALVGGASLHAEEFAAIVRAAAERAAGP